MIWALRSRRSVLYSLIKMNKGLEIGRRLRVQKYFTEQDEFPPFDQWPKWAQTSALNADKSNDARYKLFQFFWRNGLQPGRCGGFVRVLDYVHGQVKYNMEEKACKHCLQMYDQAIADKGDGALSKGRVYDLRERRPL